MIDAEHSYECCKSDVLNSIKHFKNLKYIIFDDYGAFVGVKQVVEEFVQNKTFEIEKFVGLTNDLPCLENELDPSIKTKNGKIMNTNEGVIVRII